MLLGDSSLTKPLLTQIGPVRPDGEVDQELLSGVGFNIPVLKLYVPPTGAVVIVESECLYTYTTLVLYKGVRTVSTCLANSIALAPVPFINLNTYGPT
jgi:hypothetical protein